MDITKQDLVDIIKAVVTETVQQLGVAANVQPKKERSEFSTFQKTEKLLYSYNNFKRIVVEKEQEIEEIRKYGVAKRGSAVHTYAGGNNECGLILPEESVDCAIRTVQDSVKGTVQVISMIDNAMMAISNDPYYMILEMRYFEGRTQEDIALEFNCTQQTISKNKNRLIRELALRLFPDQAIQELL